MLLTQQAVVEKLMTIRVKNVMDREFFLISTLRKGYKEAEMACQNFRGTLIKIDQQSITDEIFYKLHFRK